MILNQATIKYKGYDPDKLSKGSHKRVCCSCNRCGRITYKPKYAAIYNICKSCSKKGNKNSFYGKTHSDKTKEKIRNINNKLNGENHPLFGRKHTEKSKRKMMDSTNHEGENNPNFGKFGKDSLNWKGGQKETSKRKRAKRRGLRYIPINDSFPNCEGHHITKSLIIHIPKELHQHISHNIHTGKNMGIINLLALQFINGSL